MARIDPKVREWLREKNKGEISEIHPIRGGSIHQSLTIITDDGGSFFLKQNPHAPPDMFAREAQGLKTLQRVRGPFTPFVYDVGRGYLLMEDMQPAPPLKDFWQIFGRQMGRLHQNIHHSFGFQIDNYIGKNPQYNRTTTSGFDFYRYRRFIPQIIWARNQSLIDHKDVKHFERFLYRLPDIFPRQRPVLLHGDLWSGNLITDSIGYPAVVDPAVYYGWAEADLAMAELFGSYPDEFYQSYLEINPLVSSYLSRFPLYNLYHLLNHLNMFGKIYLPQIRDILSMFADN